MVFILSFNDQGQILNSVDNVCMTSVTLIKLLRGQTYTRGVMDISCNNCVCTDIWSMGFRSMSCIPIGRTCFMTYVSVVVSIEKIINRIPICEINWVKQKHDI